MKSSNIAPFPASDIGTYEIAADTLESELWNKIMEEIECGFPALWVQGILIHLQTKVSELSE